MDIQSNYSRTGLGLKDAFIKRTFDFVASLIGLLLSSWIIILAWITASLETRSNGIFVQKRIGKNGKPFNIFKIKTMYHSKLSGSSVTTKNDPRITKSGIFFRKTKVDELPQLINVLIGNMSFVGPRPDVPGFADQLLHDQKIVLLSIRPGITGPATIKYKNEEIILEAQNNPEEYNKNVIFPDKVNINIDYIRNYSFAKDIQYIFKTILN